MITNLFIDSMMKSITMVPVQRDFLRVSDLKNSKFHCFFNGKDEYINKKEEKRYKEIRLESKS